MVGTALAFSYLIPITILIATLPCLVQSQNSTISYYDRCKPFPCGNLTFSFPFSLEDHFVSGSMDCGLPGYQITCSDTPYVPGILVASRLYRVKDLLSSDNFIILVDVQLISGLNANSCLSLRNLTISEAQILPPALPPWNTNLTIFRCPQGLVLPKNFLDSMSRNYSCKEEDNMIYVWQHTSSRSNSPGSSPLPLLPDGCDLFLVPVLESSASKLTLNSNSTQLLDVLADGFPMTWNNTECDTCVASAGRCGFDRNSNSIACFHQQQKKKNSNNRGLIIGVVTGGCSVLLIIVLFVALKRRFSSMTAAKNQSTEDALNAKQFIKTYMSSLLNNYSYNDIKKMTNGFKEKLGEGGYGSVYKGRLSDGSLVAVKLLEKSNNIGHDFVNEVATIGRIHHVNIINLLGFSWNGSKQALIYEYMPNGSLGDLLSNEEISYSLGSAKLLEIAIEIAHGIEYLHNGCESRILHLDIKPQNVLLDNHFHPKLSDFGLAKVYSRSRSMVTITAARGTIGYIAPEIFMRNMGNPSHKSDVYSYGMLLLEIIGVRKRVELNTNSSSDAYFPSWIYEKLTEENNMDIVVEEDSLMERKMIMVGLWCIQINPKDRPSMTRVVEMLVGNVHSIEVPPKPSFFSAPSMEQDQINVTPAESETSALTLASGSLSESRK